MTSIVGICNQALGHLGNDNQIASIDPVDGSIESGYCARLYPIARRELIEDHAWGFSLKRVVLAEVTNPSDIWTYAYALPSDCVSALRILPLQVATNNAILYDEPDYARWLTTPTPSEMGSSSFELEGDVILTDEPDAVLMYKRDITDPTKFTPKFATALGYLLACYLAGPLIRGLEGAKVANEMRQAARSVSEQAEALSANATVESVKHIPDWVRNR